MSYTTQSYLLDRADIHDTILRFYHHTDRRELQRLHEILAPEVVIDYTKMFGGEPRTRSPQEVIDSFSSFMNKLTGFQHVFATILIDLPRPGSVGEGEAVKASVDANVIAYLVREGQGYEDKGGKQTSNGGWSQLELVKVPGENGNPWKVSKFKANPLWMAGNVKVLTDD